MYWYALVGVLAIAVLIIENSDIIFSRGDNQRFPEIKIYRRFLYGILAYYITDKKELFSEIKSIPLE